MAHDEISRERYAIVAYGSETGTALDYAEELGRSLERLHFRTAVCPLENLYLSSLSSCSFIIIVLSTTGQGELPQNARPFWRQLLRKKLPAGLLEDVRFTSFGLGDSSYPRYNWAARKIHKRLVQLGAEEFYARGEADDQHEEGIDGTFVPWINDLRRHLLDAFPLSSHVQPISDDTLLPPKWLLGAADGTAFKQGVSRSDGKSEKTDTIEVVLRENRRLTPSDHWQDVRHMSFASEAEVTYLPGDVLTIYPENSKHDVDSIISLMGWDDVVDSEVFLRRTVPEATSEVLSSPPPISLPTSEAITMRQLLQAHLDLNAIPRRSFFSFIAHFTDDPDQKERLIEFTKPEYIDELYDYTSRPRRSIIEVLQEFNKVKIPWQWAATVLPQLRGRQFSIASGGQLKKAASGGTRFELLVAIVKYRTVIRKMREGTCTRYLAGLRTGQALSVKLQKGNLDITEADLTKPIVMVGPGTGVAPIRSLLWERSHWFEKKSRRSDGHDQSANGVFRHIGEHLLIYGCRNRSADYFYFDEWIHLQQNIPLQFYTAFSRDRNPKMYVQDIIRQHKTEVHHLLYNLGGTLFICGSSGKMPTSVRAALADAFHDAGNLEEDAANNFLKLMEKEGRYKQETWG